MAVSKGSGDSSPSSSTSVFAPPTANGYIQNPPFDSRLGKRGAVDSLGNFTTLGREYVQRGSIVTDTSQPGVGGNSNYCLNFQFNPTSFTHSTSLNQSIPVQMTPSYPGEPTDWMQFAANMGSGVSFNLLFDRTFETWVNPDYPDRLASEGVLVDVKTLYAMLGMYHNFTYAAPDTSTDAGTLAASLGQQSSTDTSTSQVGGTDPAQVQQLSPTSPMWGIPVWAIFGTMMSYYGIIQSVDVTFTHFNQRMTPVRATVGLSMQVLPKTDASFASAASAGAALSRLPTPGGNGTGPGSLVATPPRTSSIFNRLS